MAKTVLITGAGRGIGRESAKYFVRNGYNVVINYRDNTDAAESLLSEIKSEAQNNTDILYGAAISIKADVSKREQVNEMFAQIEKEFGGVDILINNAGVSQIKLFSDITEQEWDNIFDTNVKGMFNCTQCALPYMIHQKQGRIINISSIWGICGASCEVHYSASKAAVIGFTKALAKELGPSGILVNCVAPGIIDTEMNNVLSEETTEELRQETPLGVFGKPSDIASVIYYLASSEANFITGQVISPNGGFVI